MKLMQYFGMLALLFIMSLPSFSHASYQQYDGKQASETGCYRDAITASSKMYRGMYYNVAVELRYSPSCGTNWARIFYDDKTPPHISGLGKDLMPDFANLGITRITGRHAHYSVYNSNKTGIYYTPMVYAKNDTARATLVFYEKFLSERKQRNCTVCDYDIKKRMVSIQTER